MNTDNSEFDSAEAVFIEEINVGIPLFYKPFSIGGSFLIETLEAAVDKIGTSTKNIIEEREGIHYINQALLIHSGVNDQELNQDFKKLVDSIIG